MSHWTDEDVAHWLSDQIELAGSVISERDLRENLPEEVSEPQRRRVLALMEQTGRLTLVERQDDRLLLLRDPGGVDSPLLVEAREFRLAVWRDMLKERILLLRMTIVLELIVMMVLVRGLVLWWLVHVVQPLP